MFISETIQINFPMKDFISKESLSEALHVSVSLNRSIESPSQISNRKGNLNLN